MSKVYDYIIIGSGFGGSVSAMRLSEKGYSVAVLEKGKAFKSEDFPKSNWNLPKYFWFPRIRFFGFQKLSLFKEAFILSGVGVGGGSLVYANTLMQPENNFYKNPKWKHLNDWQEILPPFYEKAKFMLGATQNPRFYKADELLREVAVDMGREETFKSVDVGVYFSDDKEEKDPYFGGEGPLRSPCKECAACMVGCRYNAKNTLDKNYLFFAQKNGAQIFAETEVVKIEFLNNEYVIHTKSSTSFFSKTKIFKSKGLIVSAGVLGTLKLLFKQKQKFKTLPDISEKLGENLLTNSESICGVTNIPEKVNHGIAISSVFNADDDTHVEVVKFPDGSGAMKLLSTLAAGPGNSLVRTIKMMFNIITHPFTFLKALFGRNWAGKTIILLVMQSSENSMKMIYSNFKGMHMKNKGKHKVPAYIPKGQEVMYNYARKANGVPANALNEIVLNTSTTAHIMGGCPMGESALEGVVNNKFEVFNYKNMYVLDGSIIPCNLGVNPSLTITALSEYAMSLIPPKNV
ncbi:MAG: GMC family oxidoreductase [Chitinophagaceae bacterium]|nr:MAG: GMC family oxidoreductase [Chitinophagaceae bacterium]